MRELARGLCDTYRLRGKPSTLRICVPPGSIRVRLVRLILVALLALACPAQALEAPPSAAPTTPVGVAALPVVRSGSQQIDDYASGLLQGLLTSEQVPGLALIVMQGDHVMVQKSVGVADPQTLAPVNGDSVFPVGALADALVAIAALQQVEQARLLLTDDAGQVIDDPRWRGVTILQLLTHRVSNGAGALARAVERRSGLGIDAYVQGRILLPLKMSQSHFEGGRFSTTASNMGRLIAALLNGGIYENGRILQPATVNLMMRTHVAAHPALPGWTLGFPEMQRGGWRALQRDGRAAGAEARLVLIPEARIGYFAAMNRNAGPDFWRVFDNSLFDRLVPPRDVPEPDLRGPPPTPERAHDVAGIYLVQRGVNSDAVFLKTPHGRLLVNGRGDGALLLSGAETGVLLPRPGGYWRSNDPELTAVYRDGQLLLDLITYDRFQLWERPGLYAWLALFLGLAAVPVLLVTETSPAVAWLGARRRRILGPALLGAAFLLLILAVVLQRLALGP
jgi:CubicO group peptidase (beta-lactamase class C family)